MIKKLLSEAVSIMLVLALFAVSVITGYAENTAEDYAYAVFSQEGEYTNISVIEAKSTQRFDTAKGKTGRLITSEQGDTNRFLACDINDELMFDLPNDTPIDITVEYFDAEAGCFALNFDTNIPNSLWSSSQNMWDTADEYIRLGGTMEWKTHTFHIERARFANRLYGGTSDFRIAGWSPEMGATNGNVIVASVKVERSEFIEPTEISFKSPYQGNVFSKDDEEIELTASFRNKYRDYGVLTKGTFKAYERDTGVAVYEQSFELEQNALEEKGVEFKFPTPDKYAVYKVELDAIQTIKKPTPVEIEINKKSEFAVSIKLTSEEANPDYGQCQQAIAFDRGEAYEVADTLRAIGGTYVRDDIRWHELEKEKGVYKIPEKFMEEFRTYKENNIKVIAICGHGNPLYGCGDMPGGRIPVTTDEQIAAFADYCYFMASELKGLVDTFSIYNEYHLVQDDHIDATPQTYAKILKAGYTAIKEANPEATVLGLSGCTPDLYAWIKTIFDEGGYDYMDAVEIHTYDFHKPLNEEVFIENHQGLNELMDQYGERKPVWVTENGYQTRLYSPPKNDGSWGDGFLGWSQVEQASAKLLTNAVGKAYGLWEKMVEYQLFDNSDDYALEHTWGVVHSLAGDGPDYPKLGAKISYLTAAAMNKYWGKDTEARDVLEENRHYAFNFYNKKLGKNVLMLQAAETRGTLVKNFNLGCSEIQLMDMCGNMLDVVVSENGIYSLPIKEIPYYVIGNFEKFEFTDTEAPIYVVESEKSCIANDTVSFELVNNTGKQLSIDVKSPESIILKENNGFIGSRAELVFDAVNASGDNTISITAKDKEGKIYYSNDLLLSIADELSMEIRSERVVEASNHHWCAIVKVTNNANQKPISGTIKAAAPDAVAKNNRVRTFDNLGPKDSEEFRFNLPVNISKRTVNAMFEAAVQGGGNYKAERLLEFSTAAYAYKKPTIDGIVANGEWMTNWFGADEQSNVVQINDWGGPDDLSFNAAMLWDEENLYFLGVVRDNIFSVNYTPNDPLYMWKGDNIQFAMDDRTNIQLYAESIFNEIGLAKLPSGKDVVYRYKTAADLPINTIIENSEISVKVEKGYTTYECRIPWSEIFYDGFKIDTNRTYLFSALTNDNDAFERRGWIEYMSGVGVGKDASKFGRITFTK